MRYLTLLCLLALTACCDPSAPDFAVVDFFTGTWRVQLSNGNRCEVYYHLAVVETVEQAIAQCRAGGPYLISRT